MRSVAQAEQLLSGPARTKRDRQTNAPYRRPGQGPDSDDRWQHDLFNPLSDVYKPQISPEYLRPSHRKQSSVSSSSTKHRIPPPTTVPQDDDMVPTSSKSGGSLIERLSSSAPNSRPSSRTQNRNDNNNNNLDNNGTNDASLIDRLANRNGKPVPQKSHNNNTSSNTATTGSTTTATKISQPKPVPAEPKTTCVVVTNLVTGTSSEDVVFAFQDFGTIADCKIAQQSEDTLSAYLYFLKSEEAKTAVEHLNGAMADGRTLEVFIQATETKPKSTNSLTEAIRQSLPKEEPKKHQALTKNNASAQPQQQQTSSLSLADRIMPKNKQQNAPTNSRGKESSSLRARMELD